ncbi:tRNA-dihydrouridine(20) synthase [NAD(P)+] [Cyberlindnera fabianii]|uniref:tRNA-dihydrouridine synthase n=1 Tax=Cyberlindnera fabianii TaxID=36022 RepID=A0A1V2LAF2_CYBFA|nr:tRNA-dihydrouridine(20) synthase [NAD(P)+] [Cyberlindnera fabianii]
MVDYRGALVLAPMVRAGELPTRLLALRHGADLVWGPEIIDKKIVTCDRIENQKLGTVDYLSHGYTKVPGVTNLVFRTHPKLEAGKLIFQMGTANADVAVQAANMIIDDVDGIDINAGCPKHFSIHAGMGAALLKTPDLLCSILTNLVEKVGKPKGKPISVKIRLLHKEEDTLNLVERLVNTGISNLTLHCRTQEMRNREAPIRVSVDKVKKICVDHGVNFIINGALTGRKEFEELQEVYGKDMGGMIAENAERNPSVFSLTPLDWAPLIKEYIEIAESMCNYIGNSKYMLTKMIPGKSIFYQYIARSKSYDDLREAMKKLNDDGTEKKQEEIEVTKDDEKDAEEETNDKKRKTDDIQPEEIKRQQTGAITA